MKLILPVLLFICAIARCPAEMTYKNGHWTMRSGLDNRLRYESMGDFRSSADDTGNVFYNRLRVRSGITLEDTCTLFIEGLDAREWTHSAPRRGNYDDLDLHQAYIEAGEIGGSPLTMKLGRQKISYGKKRMLSAPTWSNKIRAFDAALVGLDTAPVKADLFAGYVISYEDSKFNEHNDDESLVGIYGTVTPRKNVLVDIYLLGKDRTTGTDTNTVEQERRTVGVRANVITDSRLEIDAEAAYQFGDDGNLDVSAYAFACYVQQGLEGPMKPSLKAEFHIASGDSDASDDKSGTFMPPYQTTHGPYGIIDFFKLQNMREIALSCTFSPTDTTKVQPEIHAYWLDDTNDSWYRSSGKTLWTKSADSSPSSYAGSELSLVARQAVAAGLKAEAGYSAFLCGDVADEISDDDVVHYGYVQVTFEL